MAPTRPSPPLIPGALLALCLAVAALGVAWPAWDMFSPARRPMLQGWDDSFYYFWLPSVVIDRDLDFSNQLNLAGTVQASAVAEAFAQAPTPTGLLQNKYPPGWALGSLPFFLAAHLGAPAGANGFEPRYLLAVWLGQLLYAAAGLGCAVAIVARYFPPRAAAVAVFATWLASPLVYYQSARLSMSHSQVFALATFAAWLALKLLDGDTRLRTWALLGSAAALLVVTRNVAVAYLALPAFAVVRRLRTLRPAAALALGALGPLAVQCAAWKILYGTWLAYSYGGERFDFASLHLAAVLFSPRHGWFYWHPLLAPALGVFAVWAWPRPEGRAWLVSLAAILLLNAAWPTWWLGSSFGHRGFEAATLFAMLGLAAALDAAGRSPLARRALAVLVGAAIAWNLLLLALFLTQRISREDAVTWADAFRALAGWLGTGR